MDDCLIIGGGVAGLSAAIYARRYQMKTVLYTGSEPGGATATASLIENYPGIKSIDGYDLYKTMFEQAKGLGAKIINTSIVAIECHPSHYVAVDEAGDRRQSKTIVIANGTSRRHLGLRREKELTGKGISYCATCDAPLYKGKEIAIIGGGDASVKGALVAAPHAAKIYLISREPEIKAEPFNLNELKSAANVEVITETEVEELVGTDRLIGIKLSKPYNGSKVMDIDGLFIEIGADPDTHLAKSIGVKVDKRGHIDVDKVMRTNIDGIFAAGDITNGAGGFWQDIVAASQGAIAATSAFEFIGDYHHVCGKHAKAHAKVGE